MTKRRTVYAFKWFDRERLVELNFDLKDIYRAFRELWDDNQIKGERGLWQEQWYQQPVNFGRQEFIKTGQHTFKEYKGEWEREVRKKGYCYRVTAQHNTEPKVKVLRALLSKMRPYFNDFNWNVYDVEGDIYLKTSAGSLYVPVEALIHYDWSLIQDRMDSYFSWYCSTPENEEKLWKSVLASPEAVKLKEILL